MVRSSWRCSSVWGESWLASWRTSEAVDHGAWLAAQVESLEERALLSTIDERSVTRAADLGIQLEAQPREVAPGIWFLGTGPAPGSERPKTVFNRDAADTTNTENLWTGGSLGLNLDGQGVNVAVWDGGAIRGTHQELANRVSTGDGSTQLSDHATHVAGTIAATGVNPLARGMANAATITSYDFGNDLSEIANAAPGIQLSNHSYGQVSGWTGGVFDATIGVEDLWLGDRATSATEDSDFGRYGSSAAELDRILHQNPHYLSIWAAGNDRNDRYTNAKGDNTYVAFFSTPPAAGTNLVPGFYRVTTANLAAPGGDGDNGTGFDSIGGSQIAKNNLVVGAIEDATADPINRALVTTTTFSSYGPTDDGRLRPDVVANGAGLTSSTSGNDTAYGSFSGTSMASPNVTGTAALLLQHYRNLYGNQRPLSSTQKGLLIHNATDVNHIGPDYATGYGLIDGARSATFLTGARTQTNGHRLYEDQFRGTSRNFSVSAGGGGPLKATLVWTDPPGTPINTSAVDNRTPVLVNNLNLTITGPDGTVYRSWSLNPERPNDAAVRDRANNVDNVEQVLIDLPTGGEYVVTVSGPNGVTQNFSLLISGATAAGAELDVFVDGTPTSNGTTVALGAVQVGSPQILTIRLQNNGSQNLILNPASVTGPLTVLTNVPANTALAANTHYDLRVQVTANAVADLTGTLVFSSNDANEAPFRLTFTAQGTTFYRQVDQTPLSSVYLQAGTAGVESIASLANADDATAAINLGTRTFNYDGTRVTGSQLFVSSNGLLSLQTGNSSYVNTDLNGPEQSLIAVLWDDLTTRRGEFDHVLYAYRNVVGDATEELVVQWTDVSYVNGANFDTITFQAILQLNTGDASGDIYFNYLDISNGQFGGSNNGASATVGLRKENETRSDNRLLVSHNSTGNSQVASGRTIRFRAAQPLNSPPVINDQTFTIAENSANGATVGTVAVSDANAGQRKTFRIANSSVVGALNIETATGRVFVQNGALLDFEQHPVITLTVRVTDDGSPNLSDTAVITVNLTNVAEPEIEVRAGAITLTNGASLGFPYAQRGNVATQTFTVRNLGNGPLVLQPLNLTGPAFWLTSNFLPNQQLAAGAQVTFTVALNTQYSGAFRGRVVLRNNDFNGDEREFAINLTGTVLAPAGAVQTIDDGEAGFSLTGAWTTTTGGRLNDQRTSVAGNGSSVASWTFFGLQAGSYRVSATWLPNSSRATNAPYRIRQSATGANLLTAAVNQRQAPESFRDGDTNWRDLGVVTISGNTLVVQLTNATSTGTVNADSIRIERIPAVIIDNGAPGFATTGAWRTSTSGRENDVQYAAPSTAVSVATWTFTGLAAGTYRVAATWSASGNRAENAPFRIRETAAGVNLVGKLVNQRVAPNDFSAQGSAWENLGTVTIAGSTVVVVLTNQTTTGIVIADAIRLERVTPVAATSAVLASDSITTTSPRGTPLATVQRPSAVPTPGLTTSRQANALLPEQPTAAELAAWFGRPPEELPVTVSE